MDNQDQDQVLRLKCDAEIACFHLDSSVSCQRVCRILAAPLAGQSVHCHKKISQVTRWHGLSDRALVSFIQNSNGTWRHVIQERLLTMFWSTEDGINTVTECLWATLFGNAVIRHVNLLNTSDLVLNEQHRLVYLFIYHQLWLHWNSWEWFKQSLTHFICKRDCYRICCPLESKGEQENGIDTVAIPINKNVSSSVNARALLIKWTEHSDCKRAHQVFDECHCPSSRFGKDSEQQLGWSQWSIWIMQCIGWLMNDLHLNSSVIASYDYGNKHANDRRQIETHGNGILETLSTAYLKLVQWHVSLRPLSGSRS